MILIQSSNEDPSTIHVVQWLLYYKKKFLRLNDVQEISAIRLTDEGISITIPPVDIDLKDITAYWYRRGLLTLQHPMLQEKDKQPDLEEAFHHHADEEGRALLGWLVAQLVNHKNAIGNPFNAVSVNKLTVLEEAAKAGFVVPESMLTDRKKDVISFRKKVKRLVTKAIAGAFNVATDTYWYPNYTTELTADKINLLPERFRTSLFQELIEKKIEIRVFYLKGKCYAMAIFSQSDDQTKVDFRNYNYETPNRTTPFNLPVAIKRKITMLMKNLSFQTGSIDLIYTVNKEYVFLEVNPIGQFGMVSYPCNYYLEREMARTLCV